MKKNILIVGGTSGVGLKLAQHYISGGHNVCITGRKNPELAKATFQELAMTDDPARLAVDIDRVLQGFAKINTLIYAVGFLQRGQIDTLADEDLGAMLNVGLLAPMMFVQRLKNNAPTPLKIMFVTSSSQFTARELEPAYCATKSGMGILGASLARDHGIGKVLVVAPSCISTPFWEGTGENTDAMLDEQWVSDQIVELSSGAFKYKYAKILREPARIEIVECLDDRLTQI